MEDGEILDDDVDDLYTPLPRPAEPEPSHRGSILEESDPSEEDSDSYDSDTAERAPKKQKLRPSARNKPDVAKKYNIWSSSIQEEVLMEELNNCEVNQRFERSRDIESYDYTLFKEGSSEPPVSNKRNFTERQSKGIKSRLGRRRGSKEEAKGSPREMLDLVKTKDDPMEDVARDIANKLGEEKEELILRVVEVIGPEKAIEIFELTRKIELDGGMLVMNQSRRRTPGGVFLFHVKNGSSQEENQKMFTDDRRQIDAKKRIERSKQRRERARLMQKRLEEGNLLGMPRSPHTDVLSGEEEDPGRRVRNPPPSPATDGKAESSPEVCPATLHQERSLTTYDDDILDVHDVDNMDVF